MNAVTRGLADLEGSTVEHNTRSAPNTETLDRMLARHCEAVRQAGRVLAEEIVAPARESLRRIGAALPDHMKRAPGE